MKKGEKKIREIWGMPCAKSHKCLRQITKRDPREWLW